MKASATTKRVVKTTTKNRRRLVTSSSSSSVETRTSRIIYIFLSVFLWTIGFSLLQLPEPTTPHNEVVFFHQQHQDELIRKRDDKQQQQQDYSSLVAEENSKLSNARRPDADLLPNIEFLQLERDILQNLTTTTTTTTNSTISSNSTTLRLKVKKVQTCHWWRKDDKGIMRLVATDACNKEASNNLIVYNPLEDTSRYVDCGILIEDKKKKKLYPRYQERPPRRLVFEILPQSFHIINETCWKNLAKNKHAKEQQQPRIRLFPATPRVPTPGMKITASWEDELGGIDLPPIRISPPPSTYESKSFRKFGCDVNCERNDYKSNVEKKWIESKWKFRYSMESSGYYPELLIKSDAYKDNEYYATTSFDSEIPLPYYSWAEYNIHQPSTINFTNAIKGASFIARNCNSNNNREQVVSDLISSKIIRVDSLSGCLHNAEPPNNITSMSNKILLQQQYLFHLAFENTCEDDYITEKLWGTLASGTIPVYYGAPNIKDHAPPHSIISWHDFNDTIKLAEYLKKVANNQTLYESYHKWRNQTLDVHAKIAFETKYNFTHVHSICRMCRWGYAKKYGYGWDHSTQSIQEIKLGNKRTPCISKLSNLLIHPIKERWFSNIAHEIQQQLLLNTMNDDEQTNTECLSDDVATKTNETQRSSTLSIGGGKSWKRTVEYQDGVLDITIQNDNKDKNKQEGNMMILQLELPIYNGTMIKTGTDSQPFFQYQNATSRIHVWFSWMYPQVELSSQDDFSTNNMMNIAVGDDHFGSTTEFNDSPMRIRVLAEDADTFHKGAVEDESYYASVMKKDFLTPVEYFSIQEED